MVTKTPPQLRRKPTAVDIVRGGPRTSYKKVAGINAGTDYKILGKYHTGQSGDIGTWWQIERPDPDIDSKWGDNVDSGWVRGDNVVIDDDVSGVCVTWQPYTATLRTGSLALPFVPDPEEGVIRITSLFDDPRRGPTGWVPEQRDLPIHNGIDWAMAGSVYAMAAGRVADIVTGQPENDRSAGYGNRVVVQSSGFRITYAHLSTVAVAKGAEVIPYDPSLKKKNTPLGTAGRTGFSTGVHLHAYLEPDYITEIPANHKHIGGAVNFQDYLPTGHYIWPNIKALQDIIDALQDEIDAGTANSNELAVLNRDIDQWMDSHLRGGANPNGARLWVKPGAKVYRFPTKDEACAYPGRPTPGVAIVGKDNAVWDLPHPFAETLPTPTWWKIKGNSFPSCWVHRTDTWSIGDRFNVGIPLPLLPENPPQFLNKNTGTNVRTSARTQSRNAEGKLVSDTTNAIFKRRGPEGEFWGTAGELVLENKKPVPPHIAGWVPILDLAADETTEDYLWYKIPYDTENASARGWVRGDVVEIKSSLSQGETNAFPGIYPMEFADCTIPQVSTQQGQVVEAYDYPDKAANTVSRFEGSGVGKGISQFSPLWYQVQLTDTRRGWVPAGQVTAHHMERLRAVQPRLRRWSGHTTAVPVRSGPALGEAVLATIAADSTAWHNLLGRDAAYPGWWHIQYNNTVSGWVRADDAVETEGNLNSAPPPQVGLANPAQDCVVRAQPTATATTEGTIAAGSTKLHPVLERDANPATWYRIRFSDTVNGWVSAACVRLHGDGRNLPIRPQASLKPTVTNGVKVRFGPGQEHAWIASIPGGSTVRYDILGQDAATPVWWQIRFSDTVVGWVHKDNMLTHGSLENLTVTWLPQLSPRADAKAGLNVHAGPGVHHRVLVTLPVDATRYYDILGRDAAATAWYQIRVGALLIGWVPREYVQTRGPLANLPVTWTPDPQVDADPATESGTSLNQASHHNGAYTLDFNGSTVAAEFSSSSSPVQYYARADQGRAPVFRILDPDLRPAEKVVLSTDTAQEVNRDGTPKTGGMPRTLKLEVHTNGDVHYVDEGLRHIGYLNYRVKGSWTPAAAVPRERGASLNQTEHRNGAYTLTARDDTVHAVFASSSSSVQYFARADQGRAPVFRIADAALRPAATTTLTVADAREVNRDGTPKTGGVDRTFKLEVHIHQHRPGGQPRRHPQDRRGAPHPQAGGAAQRRGPLRGRGPAPDRLPELQHHRRLAPHRRCRHRG